MPLTKAQPQPLILPPSSHPGFKSSKYYLHLPELSNIGATNTVLSSNALSYTPLFLSKKVTLDRLVIRVNAIYASSLTRIGIYANSLEGLPSDLLLDAGQLDTSAVGFKESVISKIFEAGWYWLAANCNNIPPNLNSCNLNPGSLHYLGSSTPIFNNNGYSYQQTSVPYGGLPISAPISNLSVRGLFPIFWFRVA